MTNLTITKKIYKGLLPRNHFDGDKPSIERPHCILGEYKLVTKRKNFMAGVEFLKKIGCSTDEISSCEYVHRLTHNRALGILRRAIKRLQRKER